MDKFNKYNKFFQGFSQIQKLLKNMISMRANFRPWETYTYVRLLKFLIGSTLLDGRGERGEAGLDQISCKYGRNSEEEKGH